MNNIHLKIQNLIEDNPIILFIKGSKTFPSCGFSQTVVNIFNVIQVPYATFNVLENEEIRQEIKSYSNWPTIPQVYINGEFVGGADIIVEMYQKGLLQEKVETFLAQ
uniref:glutaredoxin n=1 Tax=Rhodaphanes brevistipitata TaxID=446136 RepID=UPI001FCD6290|nr:glutaredoxin [Rhodaphanes brevistipitata]UNJ18471.1 glutaredoxin [Rhodaphanes brevistipitata]